MLDDRQAETGAAVGAAAREVHPVEALEDPLDLGRRDADAVVRHGDLDVVVVAPCLDVRGDDHPGTGIGVDDAVLDQIPHRDPQLAGAAQHLGARGAGNGQRDLVLFGVHLTPVDRVAEHLVDVDHLRVRQRIVGLKPGQFDDLADEIGEPGRFDPHPAREPADRIGVLGRVLDRLGKQRDRPDRGLELVADVGHEVPPRLLDPARGRQVVGEHDDQVVLQRRDPDREVHGRRSRTPGDLQVDSTQGLFPAYAAHQLEEFGDGDPVATDQTERPGAARRLQHLVMRTDDDAGGVQDRQHLRDPGRHHGIVALEGRRRLEPGAAAADPHDQHAQDDAHDQRDGGGRDRVHRTIVGATRRPNRHRDEVTAGGHTAFGTCSYAVHRLHGSW